MINHTTDGVFEFDEIKTRVAMELTNKVINNQLKLIDLLQNQALTIQDKYPQDEYPMRLAHAINDLNSLLTALDKSNFAISLTLKPHE